MPRVLLLATTTGYQTRAFGEAADRLGVELVFATDRCHMLDDPWQDHAIPIRFYDEEESTRVVVETAHSRPFDGILVVGDRPTVIAARVARALGLAGHPPEAAAVARHKRCARERLRDRGCPVPWFVSTSVAADPDVLAPTLSYPCVVKPVALSGSRGVMRADEPRQFVAAFERLRALLRSPDILAERSEAHEAMLVEGFIPGREYAVEGLMHHGTLKVLAIFDKPDPLDGPFFEETIYVTPSTASPRVQQAITAAVAQAATATGLWHGPIHAECRVPSTLRPAQGRPEPGRGTTSSGQATEQVVFILEVAARPIGGLCAGALRFEKRGRESFSPAGDEKDSRPLFSLEELLLRHALGEPPDGWQREASASGVMMIPIPRRGVFRRVDGVEAARRVTGIEQVRVTAKTDQALVPLPEGASYLGFIFARGDGPGDVERALRAAHARLNFEIDPELQVLAQT